MTSVETTRHVERVVGTGTDDFDRVRSRVERLARIGAVSLVVPSRVTMARGDQVAVTEPPRENDTLRTVLDARGALRAGECVWLGTAVAEALALLHKNGLVHGALDAEAVVLEGGLVRLARLVDGDDDSTPADDVAALGRLLASVVRDSDADRIGAWTDPMTHQDPHGRPSAAMVVHALASCAPPEEVQQPPMGVASALRRAASPHKNGARGAVPLHEARWWRLRMKTSSALKRFGLAIAAVGLVGGLAVGVAWATHVGPWAVSKADTAALVETLQEPEVAGERLTVARFDALSRGDGGALIALTVVGSPARADAEATASALQNGLLRVDGLEGAVEDSVSLSDAATGTPSQGAIAVVRVRYRLGPHVVIAGEESTNYEGYTQTVDLTLEWVGGTGWLVSDATVSNATVSQESDF